MGLGAWLAALLRPGDAVALEGELGAGKTTFVRGLMGALGYSGRVRSPSFTLMQEYGTTPRVKHADFYRLEDPDELVALGLDEERDEGVLLVEWAERMEGAWPGANWRVALEVTGEGDERIITVFRASDDDREARA